MAGNLHDPVSFARSLWQFESRRSQQFFGTNSVELNPRSLPAVFDPVKVTTELLDATESFKTLLQFGL